MHLPFHYVAALVFWDTGYRLSSCSRRFRCQMQDTPINEQSLRKSLNEVYHVHGTIGVLDWFRSNRDVIFSRSADGWIDIILNGSTKNKGKAAGILNALMGSCCPSPQQRDDRYLDAEFAKELFHGLTTTCFTPDLVTFSLAYAAVRDMFPELADDIISRGCQMDVKNIKPLSSTTAGTCNHAFESGNWKENLENKFGIQILHDCDDFVVLDKPSGLSLTDMGRERPSRDPSLEALLLEVGMSLSNLNDSRGFVHRLDIGTSGCLVVAKHNQAHAEWIARFFLRHVIKSYICLVDTSSLPRQLTPKGTIVQPLNGRPASSSYQVLEQFGQTAAKLRIKTTQGRKHQVRIHCSKGLDTPIILDQRYGGERIMYRTQSDRLKEARAHGRLCLHADTIGVPDLNLLVSSSLPTWWEDVIHDIMS